MRKSVFYIFSVLSSLFFSCSTYYQPQTLRYHNYDITNTHKLDSSLIYLLKPYADSLNKSMNDVIAEVEMRMEKKQPESSLGNFLADAYLFMAREKFDRKIDFAVMAPGGIRLPSIEPGPLRRGTIYEVMPFDNLMVLVTIKGELLKEYFNRMAAEGGTGVAGLRFVIRDKKAEDIYINNKPYDPSASYTMVNSDYSVNNPNASWLYQGAVRRNTDYLMRDAIIDFAIHLQKNGDKIGNNLKNRIVNGD